MTDGQADAASDAALHHRNAATLKPLFRPRSIAVVGASDGSVGGAVFKNLLRADFAGAVYPVHPTAHAVASVRAYPTVLDVPDEVDLAVIAVPASRVLEVVEQCAAHGVRSLVVLSAGFAEIGDAGRTLQDRVLATVRGHGMRMIGPNCLGVVNTDPTVRMNATFGRPLATRGHLAMSSQSGAMGLAIVDYARELGLGLSQFVSVGNKADVSGNDLLEYWEDDPDTSVIALYLESFGNPRRFSRIARRVARTKPILAVKSGRGRSGQRAARSHTAALAGSDVGAEALFRQAGVTRLDTLEELFEVASLMTNQPLPAGDRVAIITNAGGPGILCADACEAHGLALPELSEDTLAAVRQVLPATAGLGNPIDMIATASPAQYEQVTRNVLSDPSIDALIAINIAVTTTRAEAFGEAIRAGATAAIAAGVPRKPVIACFMGTGDSPSALQEGDALDDPVGTIPSYRFPESAARALSHAAEHRRWLERAIGEFAEPAGVDATAARAIAEGATRRGADWLTPDEARQLMMCAGIPVARQGIVETPEDAARLADSIGYPVVVKAVGPEIVHKSEIGGVILDLGEPEAVWTACREMRTRIERDHGVAVPQFLVQEQARMGREVLVGVTSDPVFGPLVGFGLGGVEAEALQDVTFRLTPLSDVDAQEMPRSLRGHALLEGFRGRPPVDLQAIEDLLLRVSWLADTVRIREMDLNPVTVYEASEGLLVVDVRVALLPPTLTPTVGSAAPTRV